MHSPKLPENCFVISMASLRWIFSSACTRSIKVVSGNRPHSHWMTSFVGLLFAVDSPENSWSTSLGTLSLQARCLQFLIPGTSSRLRPTAIVCKSSEPGVITSLINNSSELKHNIRDNVVTQTCINDGFPKRTKLMYSLVSVTIFSNNLFSSCLQK